MVKLVAAKCPSCGANIDVDKNSDTTKCEFCDTKIIVEDAIQKYKIEISGKVKIDKSDDLDNYIKLAERYFDSKNYKESEKYYTKIVELDPDNYAAVLRKGCLSVINSDFSNINFADYIGSVDYILLNTNNNIDINDYIFDMIKYTDEIFQYTTSKFEKSKCALKETEKYCDLLISQISFYEKIESYLVVNTSQKEYWKKCLQTLMHYLYNTQLYYFDNGVERIYTPNPSQKRNFDYYIKKYTNLKTASENNATTFKIIFGIIFGTLFFIFIIYSIAYIVNL